MIPIDYEKIEILNDIIVYVDSGRVLVYLNEVWAMGYKKPSFLNCLLTRHDWMAMGILFIATKSTKRVKDIIPIRMPFTVVQKLPKSWAKKVEFYRFGGDIKIKRIE